MGSQSTASTGGLKLWYGKGTDAFERDGSIVALNLTHTKPDLIAQEVVCAKRSHVHIAADSNELGSREIVKSQIIFEDLANLDDLVLRWRFASSSNLQYDFSMLQSVL